MAWVYVEKQTAWTGYTKPPLPKEIPVEPKLPYTKQTFLETIFPHAKVIERECGIPWLFTATQAAHESRYGNSYLTLQANNLFGVTGESWAKQGKPVYVIETTEYDLAKNPFKLRRPFRKYASWEQSLRDWSDLIVRRYPNALAAAKAQDFDSFAKALHGGGYATDPRYAFKLSGLYPILAQLVNKPGNEGIFTV